MASDESEPQNFEYETCHQSEDLGGEETAKKKLAEIADIASAHTDNIENACKLIIRKLNDIGEICPNANIPSLCDPRSTTDLSERSGRSVQASVWRSPQRVAKRREMMVGPYSLSIPPYVPDGPTFSKPATLGEKLGDESVDPKTFKNKYVLDHNLKCIIYPALLIAVGLPDSHKSAILKKLLTSFTKVASNSSIDTPTDEATDQEILQYYEILAVGNKYQEMYWSEVSTENYVHCITSAMLNHCALTGTVLHLEPSAPTLGTFKDKVLDKHFQVLYDKMKKYEFDSDETWKFLVRGLTVLNFWDMKVHPVLEHMLAIATGCLTCSYPILFLDLERDFGSLHAIEDYGNPVLYWRSKIHFLLRTSFVATTNEQLRQRGKSVGSDEEAQEYQELKKKREHVCLVVAVHNGLDKETLAQRQHELKAAVELAAVQLGVLELIETDIHILSMKGLNKEGTMKENLRALKSKLERMVIAQGAIEFPISWIFLRSSLYNWDKVYIEKDKMKKMASDCKIGDAEFQELLTIFTASGSIFYSNEIEELAKYVILSPVKFLRSLSNLFCLSFDGKSYGLITQEHAVATYGDSVEFYMDILCGTKLAVKLTPEQIDTIHLQKMPLDTLYYMPSIRIGQPERTCNPHALHMIVGLDVAPINTQVAFTNAVFQVFKKEKVEVKSIPFDVSNATQFETNHIRFQHIYHGDATEIVINKSKEEEDDAFMQQLCDLIIQSCHAIMMQRAEHHGAVKYSFAVMCSNKPSPTGSCNISSISHYLPERGAIESCISCQDASADTYLLNKWITAVEKHPIDEKRRLHREVLSMKEMNAIASYIARHPATEGHLKKLAKLLAVSANSALNPKKQVLHLLLNWESARKHTVPARVEMSEILRKMELDELASNLNLSSTEPSGRSKLQEQHVFRSSDSISSMRNDPTMAV